MFIIFFAFVCFSLANDSGTNQLYMYIQRDTSFEPILSEYMIENFTFTNKNRCPMMCLRILGCKLVMYNTADGTCVIYNSTDGVLHSSYGYMIYTVAGITTAATTSSTISTIITDTIPTTISINQVTSQSVTNTADTGKK
jgi:hypothetical protein